MHRLLAGYARFRTTVFPRFAPQFQKLAHGQQPDTLLITCSDSRVMPEMIFQSEPGEVFPIRLAGNLVPPPGNDPSGIAATIEYAIRALKIHDIVVCSHSGCGAMKELLEQAHIHDLPDVTSWLEHAGMPSKWLRSTFRDTEHFTPENRLRLLTEANTLAQLDHLRQHPAVSDGLRTNTLSLHAMYYDIATGELREFDEATGRYEPLPTEVVERKVA